MAYQGFASGNPEKDAFAVRRAISLKMPVFVAQSFAKNFGLYGERVGALSFSGNNITNLKSHLCAIVRCHFSCGPAYGARIVSRILNDPKMLKEWYARIANMRSKLFDNLTRLQTPGNWSHIKTQIGMFSFTGLSPSICEKLVSEYSIYLPKNGRISIAGLNDHNIAYFAECIDKLVRAELLPATKRQKVLYNENGQKVASYIERK
jgi:aspartate/tyrosine/aromatic aminotransferase